MVSVILWDCPKHLFILKVINMSIWHVPISMVTGLEIIIITILIPNVVKNMTPHRGLFWDWGIV